MITDSEAAQVHAALTALLDTTAPLGVLYTQFLQTKWVAAQLSAGNDLSGGSGGSGGSGRFLVASAVHGVLDRCDQYDTARRHRHAGADQENQRSQSSTATSTEPPTQSAGSSIALKVVSEYILARLYRGVPLELNPFLVHFVRVYVQQPAIRGSSGGTGGKGESIRYLLHRLLCPDSTDSTDSAAAGLSSLSLGLVVGLCTDTILDLYGNVVSDTRKQKQISSGPDQKPARYNDRYIAGLPRSWLTQVLQQQGLDYTDVLTTLRPGGDLGCGAAPVEVLARVSGVLGDAALLSLDFDNGVPGHHQDPGPDAASLNQKPNQPEVFYFEGQPGTPAQRLRALESEGGVLMDTFANAFYEDLQISAPASGTASRAAYQTQFDALVSRPEFTALQAQLLLKLWKILLQAPSDPTTSNTANAPGGGGGAAAEVRDALLDSVCTRLLPHRITNQTADFVYQMVMLAHSHDLAQSSSSSSAGGPGSPGGSGSVACRLVYGSVFRWLEAASASATASATGPGALLDPDLTLNLGLGDPSSASAFSSNAQVRLICLVLKSLKLHQVLEPGDEYVVLYGQLLPYVSGVVEARELCFPGGSESGGAYGVGESSGSGHRMDGAGNGNGSGGVVRGSLGG